jgi:hypothetical protein
MTKSEFPELDKKIFPSDGIDKGILPRFKLELTFKKGAFMLIDPEYESEITSPKYKLEIIEFEISKG